MSIRENVGDTLETYVPLEMSNTYLLKTWYAQYIKFSNTDRYGKNKKKYFDSDTMLS